MKRCDILKISGDVFKAVIFDLDGVVTDTASLHSASWKKMFDDFLEQKGQRENKLYAPFDEKSDYLDMWTGNPVSTEWLIFCLPGKSRFPPVIPVINRTRRLFYGLGNRKNEIFTEMLGAGEVKVFDSTIALIKKLRRLNIKTAIISSCKNCRNILEVAGIADLFDARV